MLHSTPSTRAFNQAHRAELAPPSDLSGSGSTIASIAFTNRNSVDKNQAELFDLSVTDMQDLNSQANYEYYLKYAGDHGDTMNYSDTFELSNNTAFRPETGYGDTMNYSDRFELSNSAGDRAIKASGHYDLSTVDEEFSQEAYSDQLELSRVVDLYKNQIEKTFRHEEEHYNSPCDPSDRVINTDKKSAIRKKCVDQMGQACFGEVYGFLSRARNQDLPDDYIFEQAVKRWGKAANGYCLLVDQLLFVERY